MYNQQLIYYIGGKITQSDDLFIYTYNTSNEEWIVSNIVKRSFPQHYHQEIQAIIDKNRRIYLFVRSNDIEFGSMIIVDTKLTDLSWSLRGMNNPNPPIARYGYTATLTNDRLIIYIGEVYQNDSYANMNEVCYIL